MQSQVLRDLRTFIDVVAEKYSNPERRHNNVNDTFTPTDIKVLSDTTAAVHFHKMPSKKLCLMFFYYVNAKTPHWAYFVPTDAHLLGIAKLNNLYDAVEEYNKKVVLNV